ncbi:MAG: methyltransferase domain-containing protein [candidate division Zixibacteria bacterium]|nr:methyltransferase domain-containing protein [candidate division Zixibacteria bacterium]
MDYKKYTEANRIAWNQAMPYHQKNRPLDPHVKFKESGYSTLDKHETEMLNKIGLDGRSVAHLCCNNGQELISIVNLGAKSGVGFDICDEAIDEAKQLAEISKANCEFVRIDVYDIESSWHDRFDLVYITIGALPWLPDLRGFFAIVAKMLKSGGILMIYESHPFLNMIATDDEPEYDPRNPFKISYSYFRDEIYEDTSGIDYYGNESYDAHVSYEFFHQLSTILNTVIASGFEINAFHEYPHDISNCFGHLEDDKLLPLCYILTAKKRN